MKTDSDERTVQGLVGQVYDAAIDPELWPAVLENITTALDASVLALFIAEAEVNDVGIFLSTGLSDDAISDYIGYYAEKDVWYSETYRQRPPAAVPRLSHEWFPDDALERTEFYNDLLRSADVFYHCGCALRYDGPAMSVFNVERPKRSGPFGKRHLELCGRLAPHLSRAVDIHRRFSDLQGTQGAALDVLNRLPMGVLLIDEDGHVTFMNKSAGGIVARNDGLTVDAKGRCRAARGAETGALQNLIKDAAKTGAGKGFAAGGAISLPRPSGLRPFAVLAAPLSCTPFDIGPKSAAAVLFVADPERRHEPPGSLLARLYGLTPMEARVAVAMLSGRSLTQVAETLGVTRNTASTHLRQVYLKTETRRQTELVKLLLTGPAGLEFPPRD